MILTLQKFEFTEPDMERSCFNCPVWLLNGYNVDGAAKGRLLVCQNACQDFSYTVDVENARERTNKVYHLVKLKLMNHFGEGLLNWSSEGMSLP